VGLDENVITESELHEIADYSTGDARVAIGNLRKVAQTAQQDSADRITLENIEDVVSETKLEIDSRPTANSYHIREYGMTSLFVLARLLRLLLYGSVEIRSR